MSVRQTSNYEKRSYPWNRYSDKDKGKMKKYNSKYMNMSLKDLLIWFLGSKCTNIWAQYFIIYILLSCSKLFLQRWLYLMNTLLRQNFSKTKGFQDINRFYPKSPWSFKYKKPWIEKKQLIICFACFLCFVIVDSDFGDGEDGVRHEKNWFYCSLHRQMHV